MQWMELVNRVLTYLYRNSPPMLSDQDRFVRVEW